MPRGTPKSGKRKSRRDERLALRPVQLDPHQLYRIDETAAARGISIATLWKQINAGTIETTTIGRRRLVRGSEIIRVNLTDAAGP